MGFLAGKRILLTGVLSNRSIAYGIARACKREGAELAFTYVGDRFKERITEFATEFGSDLVFPCDVADDAQIDALFASLKSRWETLDGIVHSIGFAPREAIAGDFLDGPAQPDPVADRGVRVGVHQGEAVRAEQTLNGAEVGLIAGGEDHRVVVPEPVRDLLFQRDMQAVGAVEQSATRGAGPEFFGRFH